MGSSWGKLQVDGNEMRMHTGVPDSAGAGNGPFPAVVVAQPATRRVGLSVLRASPEFQLGLMMPIA